MKIAFMHYHLKTGGVTTCLKQQVEALKKDCQMLVITGEKPESAFPVDTLHIPQLAYSTIYRESINPNDVAQAVINAIQTRFKKRADILHVHNPILAKNTYFLKILKALQEKGVPLFLQIHDFAEDGRPHSYFAEEYPRDCHYSVVNSRDYHFLLESGLLKEGLHQLSNTVGSPDTPPDSCEESLNVVYPIRAIRRKNIGEAILLSLFFENNETLVITLPPNSPADFESYNDWKNFAVEYRLNVEFDTGLKRSFEDIVCSAKYILTTSITEGFGYTFLEPWLFKKMVWGRKLSSICRDFETCGVRLDHMYTRLNIPTDWIDADRFFKKWQRTLQHAAQLFDINIDPDQMQNAYKSITGEGTLDFGMLDEDFQKDVIRNILSDKANLETISRLNPFLLKIGKARDGNEIIKTNRNAVLRNFNMPAYRKKLLAAYKSTTAYSVRQHIDKEALLKQFLDLKQFSLLKWSDYGIG